MSSLEPWALLVAILALVAIRDWDIIWRRLKLAGIAGLALVLVVIVAGVLDQLLLPILDRYLLQHNNLKWYSLAALSVLWVAIVLWALIQRKRRKPQPRRYHDPGDYKLGW